MGPSHPQFTIRRLMLGIAGVAMLLWLPTLTWLHSIAIVYGVLVAGVSWRSTRRMPGVALWGFLVSGALVNGGVFWIFALRPYVDTYVGLFALFVAGLSLPVVVGLGLSWTFSRGSRASRLAAALLTGAVAVSPIVMVETYWPLRLGFRLAAPALDRIADRLEAGGSVAFPEWAGFYRVETAIPFPAPPRFLLVVGDRPLANAAGFHRSPTQAAEDHIGRAFPLGEAGSGKGRWWYFDER